MEDEAQLHRFGAYRIHQSLVEKPLSINNFWPLSGDKVTSNLKVVTKEVWDKLKKKYPKLKK